MKRTFLAINIPLAGKAVDFIDTVKSSLKDEKIRWVKNCNMHVTLFFLGNTNKRAIGDICAVLTDGLQSINPFEISFKGIGIFKTVYNPKAVWLGIEESEGLGSLKSSVDNVMSLLGFTLEGKGFKPHLTIGRMKTIKHKDELKLVLDKYPDTPIQKSKVNELIFYESLLTPAGPIYGVLKKIPLGSIRVLSI